MKKHPSDVDTSVGRVVETLLRCNADCSPRAIGRNAVEWCLRGVRAHEWAFLDDLVDEDGRFACHALLVKAQARGSIRGRRLEI